VSISRRRYTHPQILTTRNEKPAGQNNENVTTAETAGKLYLTIPCDNPDSDIGRKNTTILIKQEEQKYPNISHKTTTELTVEYPVNINAPLRNNFLIFECLDGIL